MAESVTYLSLPDGWACHIAGPVECLSLSDGLAYQTQTAWSVLLVLPVSRVGRWQRESLQQLVTVTETGKSLDKSLDTD